MKSFLSRKELKKPVFILMIVLCSLASFILGASKIMDLGLTYGYGTGISMEPTFKEGTKMIVATNKDISIKRGDLVTVLGYDGDDNSLFIGKRIIGLPNESISIKKNMTYVNGNKLDEPYANYDSPSDEDIFITLGEDEYFIMGDNRMHSLDSREFGAVPRESIVGKVMAYR